MSDRLLSSNVFTEPLVPHQADQVLSGSPTTGLHSLDSLGPDAAEVEIGIWELSEGSVRDTEVDEVFVVLSGAGTVSFADGERLTLAPGVAVRLRAGEQTIWTVTSRLRKIYVA